MLLLWIGGVKHCFDKKNGDGTEDARDIAYKFDDKT